MFAGVFLLLLLLIELGWVERRNSPPHTHGEVPFPYTTAPLSRENFGEKPQGSRRRTRREGGLAKEIPLAPPPGSLPLLQVAPKKKEKEERRKPNKSFEVSPFFLFFFPSFRYLLPPQ